MTAGAADDVLPRLFAPVGSDEFFREHFERQPLHVARNDPAYFAATYSVGDVEDALHVGAAQPEQFTLVKDGVALDVTVDARVALAQFDRGYTLVISDASRFSPRLQQLCNRVARRLGGYAVANVYFTPAGARGFDVHYDNHGTIVLQIAGRKRWRLYEPTVELPVDDRLFTENQAADLTALGDVDLEPGDTLYLPQGVPHAASAGERSLHVTLALRPTRVGDLVDAVVRLAVADDVELRRSLPAGALASSETLAAVEASIGARLAAAWTSERVARAAARLRGEIAAQARPVGRGGFDVLAALDAVGPETRLRLRADAAHALVTDGTHVQLIVGSRTFTLPPSCGALLERMRTGIRYADVQAVLAPADAASLVRLLAVNGVLAIAPPSEGDS